MRTTTMHRSLTARTTHPRDRFQTPTPGPSWWPGERAQALQSTRMLSLAMLIGSASWAVVLLSALLWFTRG